MTTWTAHRYDASLSDGERRERDWWRAMAAGLEGLGRPWSKCVYCGYKYKLGYFPGEKYEVRPHCDRERFVAGVVFSFPMLRRDMPGLTPWDPIKWARAWRGGAQTSGSYHAVAFCLSLWAGCNADEWRRRGYSFDVVAAFGVWDDRHRAAFLKWCANPWRP